MIEITQTAVPDFRQRSAVTRALSATRAGAGATGLALLAKRQLQRAIGDLKYENEVCVEVPDTEDAELAILTVSLLTEQVRELKREWYRRFDTATEAARQAR